MQNKRLIKIVSIIVICTAVVGVVLYIRNYSKTKVDAVLSPTHNTKKVNLTFAKVDLSTPDGKQKIVTYMNTSQTQYSEQAKQDLEALQKFK